jgi:hypothetical protein
VNSDFSPSIDVALASRRQAKLPWVRDDGVFTSERRRRPGRCRRHSNSILPYFIIPSTFSPQASSPLERYGRTDKFQHPPLPSSFFFPLSARGGPTRRRNSTYWAGRTLGWMADWTSTLQKRRYVEFWRERVSHEPTKIHPQRFLIKSETIARKTRRKRVKWWVALKIGPTSS